MSADRRNYQYKTILDFTNPRLSKNFITQSLRRTNFVCSISDEHTGIVTHVEPEVKVGMFKIHLVLSPTSRDSNFKNLRNYGKFYIKIYELSSRGEKEINSFRDPLFKKQYWASKNFKSWLKIKDLINIIMYLNKIDKLKAFL